MFEYPLPIIPNILSGGKKMFHSKSSSFFKCITIFTLTIIITIVTGCSNQQNSAASSIKNINQNNELINNTKKGSDTTNNNSRHDNTLTESEKNPIKITIGNKEFNLSVLLNRENVQDLDDFQLSLLRNAYYTKHGYKFNMKKYLDFFSKYN